MSTTDDHDDKPDHGGKPEPLPAAKVIKDELKTPAAPAVTPPLEAVANLADKLKAKTSRGPVGTDANPLAIELEASRERSAGWTIGGGLIGGLLIWKLGTVGVWAGFVLVAIAVYNAWHLLQTFLHEPGTIIVTDREVTLPRGLSMPRPVKASRADVTAVYFLRRSVPWNHAAPVLVVELGERALAYPRDWFASEADQRHIIHALLRDKKLVSAEAEPAA